MQTNGLPAFADTMLGVAGGGAMTMLAGFLSDLRRTRRSEREKHEADVLRELRMLKDQRDIQARELAELRGIVIGRRLADEERTPQ